MNPMSPKPTPARKVGLLVLAALGVFAVAIFLVGERRNLFRSKNDYSIFLDSVSGLDQGSNVQLDGVNVGSISEVVLAEDVRQSQIEVRVRIDARYSGRLREDSMARTRTLGLLGDKYIEISSGTPSFPELPEGGRIGTAPVTDVDKLRTSGEDLIQNVTRITEQLTTILGRMERGEGLLGELTRDVEPDRKVTTDLLATLEEIRGMFADLRTGEGPIPRLLNDDALGDKLASTVTRLDSIAGKIEDGGGAASMLLTDAEQRARLERSLASIEKATANLEKVSVELQGTTGLLPKLVNDDVYGEQLAAELKSLLENLNRVAEKLDHGQGSAALLLNDPQLYTAIKDIISGVDESAILKKILRNRQKKGAEKRLEEQVESTPPAGSGG
jgi:phospholipid/cholesterol/gamma-HCH transport system substrate-binding protein